MKVSKGRGLLFVVVLVALQGIFAASVIAGAGAVSVSDIKAEWKKKSGADKDKEWLKLSFHATPNEKVEKYVYPKLKVSCKVGSETVTDELTSLTTKFHEGEVGKAAAHDARVFFDKGEGVVGRADSCTLEFGYGKSTKKDDFTSSSSHCLTGTAVADGACK